MSMLTLIAPLLVSVATWLFERVVTNWKSTATGAAFGGAFYEVLNTFGCDPNLVAPAVLAAVAAAPKVLGSDADKIAPTLWAAMQAAVAQKRQSDAVVAAAEAEQAKFKTPPTR